MDHRHDCWRRRPATSGTRARRPPGSTPSCSWPRPCDLERIDLYTQHDRPLTPQEVAAYRALIARRARARAGGLHPGPGLLPPSVPGGAARRAHPAAGDRGAGGAGAGHAAAPARLGRPARRSRPRTGEPGAPAPRRSIADVGTGSGAIALSLAQEAGVRVLAIDASAGGAGGGGARTRRPLGLDDLVDAPAGRPAGRRRRRQPPPGGEQPALRRAPATSPLSPPTSGCSSRSPLSTAGPTAWTSTAAWCPRPPGPCGPGGTLLLEVGEDQAGAVCDLARGGRLRLGRRCTRTCPARTASWRRRFRARRLLARRRIWASAAGAGAARAPSTPAPSSECPPTPCTASPPAGTRRRRPPALRRQSSGPRSSRWPCSSPRSRPSRRRCPTSTPRRPGCWRRCCPAPTPSWWPRRCPGPSWSAPPTRSACACPTIPPCCACSAAVDVPLAATSANLTGRPTPATAAEVDPWCWLTAPWRSSPRAGLARRSPGVASTVVDLRPLADGGAPAGPAGGRGRREMESELRPRSSRRAASRPRQSQPSGILGVCFFREEEATPIE